MTESTDGGAFPELFEVIQGYAQRDYNHQVKALRIIAAAYLPLFEGPPMPDAKQVVEDVPGREQPLQVLALRLPRAQQGGQRGRQLGLVADPEVGRGSRPSRRRQPDRDRLEQRPHLPVGDRRDEARRPRVRTPVLSKMDLRWSCTV